MSIINNSTIICDLRTFPVTFQVDRREEQKTNALHGRVLSARKSIITHAVFCLFVLGGEKKKFYRNLTWSSGIFVFVSETGLPLCSPSAEITGRNYPS